MNYKLNVSDVVKVVFFVGTLFATWYSMVTKVEILGDKVIHLERQLEETNLGVIKNDIEYIKQGQEELKNDLREYYSIVAELLTGE